MPRKSSTLDEAVMLIQILTRIPKGRLITAQQLKQELDAAGIPIQIRTLQRYLKTMASTDVFGIDCDMRSRPYGYKQSTAGGTLLSQQMSVHECLLLRLAQEHMRFMIPTTLSKSLSPLFDMASQKFNETLSADSRNEEAWLKKIAVVGSSLPMMPPKISRTIFEAVSEALFRELKLEIEYDSASGKQVKSLITPLGLVQQDVRLYLVCMFDRYENVRHLALHRLTKARVTEFQADRPKDFSLDSYVNSCHFNYSDGSGRKVELSFRFTNAVTALNLNETPFNRTQRIEKLPDGSFHLSVILTDSPLIDGWIAVWKDKAGISELTRTPRHRTTGKLTCTEERFSAPSALRLRRLLAAHSPPSLRSTRGPAASTTRTAPTRAAWTRADACTTSRAATSGARIRADDATTPPAAIRAAPTPMDAATTAPDAIRDARTQADAGTTSPAATRDASPATAAATTAPDAIRAGPADGRSPAQNSRTPKSRYSVAE